MSYSPTLKKPTTTGYCPITILCINSRTPTTTAYAQPFNKTILRSMLLCCFIVKCSHRSMRAFPILYSFMKTYWLLRSIQYSFTTTVEFQGYIHFVLQVSFFYPTQRLNLIHDRTKRTLYYFSTSRLLR